MTGGPGSRSPRRGKLTADERRIVEDIGESYKAFGRWPTQPEIVPVDLAARAAERAYRRGVVQGAYFMLWHLSPESRADHASQPAFLGRLTRWHQRGKTEEYAKAEPAPPWDAASPARPPTVGNSRRIRLTRASDIKPAARGTRRPEWGPWDVDRAARVLWTTAPGYVYEVDLDDCTTSARVLDWICQVAGKQWQDREHVIAGLVTALDDILSPQATLCLPGQPAAPR